MDQSSNSNSAIEPSSSSQNSNDDPYHMKASDYGLGKAIGFGSSGIVYVASYKPIPGKKVAIKMIELDRFERNQIDELRKEIQVMTLCKHPNLLPIYASFVDESKLWIVTPLLSAGSCLDIMKHAFPEGFEEPVIAAILSQALQGLDYLHKNGLIHRDVKAGNLLMDEKGAVQLADFGVSSSLTDEGERKAARKTFVGTPCWMAPEVMEMSKGYDYRADIWSFGITAFELFQGHAPYSKYPPMKVIFLTMNNEPPSLKRKETKKRNSKQFAELVNSCLQKDPSKRLTCDQLAKLSFIKNAKKSSFLAVHVASKIPPIDDRAKTVNGHVRNNENNDHSEQEWDFSGDEDEESVSFGIRSSRPSNLSASGKDEILSVKSNSDEQVAASLSKSGPKKTSRFVVDGINTSTNAGESLTAMNSTVDPNSTTSSSAATATAAEVKKGRFSVINPSNSNDVLPSVTNNMNNNTNSNDNNNSNSNNNNNNSNNNASALNLNVTGSGNNNSISLSSSKIVANINSSGSSNSNGSNVGVVVDVNTASTIKTVNASSDSITSNGSDVKSSRRTFEVRSVSMSSGGVGADAVNAATAAPSGSVAATGNNLGNSGQVLGRFTINNNASSSNSVVVGANNTSTTSNSVSHSGSVSSPASGPPFPLITNVVSVTTSGVGGASVGGVVGLGGVTGSVSLTEVSPMVTQAAGQVGQQRGRFKVSSREASLVHSSSGSGVALTTVEEGTFQQHQNQPNSQLDSLLKQCELQRQMIMSLMTNSNISGIGSNSNASPIAATGSSNLTHNNIINTSTNASNNTCNPNITPTVSPNSTSTNNNNISTTSLTLLQKRIPTPTSTPNNNASLVSNTVDILVKQVSALIRENEELRKENDRLRMESAK